MVARLSKTLPDLTLEFHFCRFEKDGSLSFAVRRLSVHVFQCTKARLKSWTEDEAHNLTRDDPVWELVKAADQAVLTTATPLKQVAELQGVAGASVCRFVIIQSSPYWPHVGTMQQLAASACSALAV